MSNYLSVPNSNTHITWTKRNDTIYFTVRNEYREPIAKAKLTAEQLHKYICLHSTMEQEA